MNQYNIPNDRQNYKVKEFKHYTLIFKHKHRDIIFSD